MKKINWNWAYVPLKSTTVFWKSCKYKLFLQNNYGQKSFKNLGHHFPYNMHIYTLRFLLFSPIKSLFGIEELQRQS
jgi:hypothetical protein